MFIRICSSCQMEVSNEIETATLLEGNKPRPVNECANCQKLDTTFDISSEALQLLREDYSSQELAAGFKDMTSFIRNVVNPHLEKRQDFKNADLIVKITISGPSLRPKYELHRSRRTITGPYK